MTQRKTSRGTTRVLPSPPEEPRVRVVDWNAWRESYVIAQEEEAVRRYGRTSAASSAGTLSSASVQATPTSEEPLLPGGGKGNQRFRSRRSKT